MTVDQLLEEIERNNLKVAQDNKAPETSESSESTSGSTSGDLSETISKILGTSKKEEESKKKDEGALEISESGSEKTSCVKSASALSEIEKLAEEVKEAQYEQLLKEAHLLGAALIDGAMLRQQEWMQAAEKTAMDELVSDPVAYAAFLKGAEDAVKDVEKSESESESDESKSEESTKEEESSKTASDEDILKLAAEAMEEDPLLKVAYYLGSPEVSYDDKDELLKLAYEEAQRRGDQEAMEDLEKIAEELAIEAYNAGAEQALLDKLASDPEAAEAFKEGYEDAIVEKIASDPEALQKVAEAMQEDPLLAAGYYLGSPEVPLENKVEILKAAYDEAVARGDQEAVEDLNKIAADLDAQISQATVFKAASDITTSIINELRNS
jgi:hypothetical protein